MIIVIIKVNIGKILKELSSNRTAALELVSRIKDGFNCNIGENLGLLI